MHARIHPDNHFGHLASLLDLWLNWMPYNFDLRIKLPERYAGDDFSHLNCFAKGICPTQLREAPARHFRQVTSYKYLNDAERAASGGRITRQLDERITQRTLVEFYMRHRNDDELKALDFLLLMGPARFAQALLPFNKTLVLALVSENCLFRK